MEIYLVGTRFMIMEVNESFSFETKAKAGPAKSEGARLGSSSCGDSSKRCRKESLTKNGCAWNVFLSWNLLTRLIHVALREAGSERPGILLDDGSCLDVSAFVSDYDEALFAEGGMDALRDWHKPHFSSASRVPSTTRLGRPICRPGGFSLVRYPLIFIDRHTVSVIEKCGEVI